MDKAVAEALEEAGVTTEEDVDDEQTGETVDAEVVEQAVADAVKDSDLTDD